MKFQDFENWVKKLDTLMDGVSVDGSEKTRCAVSLFHLCIEHNKGVCVCLKGEAPSSAFSLFRPLFEALIRGLWVSRCAPDDEVSKFVRGGEPPKIRKQVEEIEKSPDFSHGKLGEYKKRVWKLANDFTHGGSVMVRSRNTKDEIISNYSVSEIQWVLSRSSELALIAAVESADLAGDADLSNQLLVAHEALFKKR